jgi:hypothetical protein
MATRGSMAVALATALAVGLLAPSAATEPAPCPEDCWRPSPTTQPWQWQLTGRVDLAVMAPVYDVDGFDTGAGLVDRIHAKPARAICYLSVGTYERWRPDAHRFPNRVLGRPLEPPFQNERWLDIRRLQVLKPIMRRRFGICARKGFDAVEPDNVDGFQNPTGFPLSRRDQFRYDRWVANAAHRQGLAVGLKNDLAQVRRLLLYFDFAVNEQCFEYHECSKLDRFIATGKPVFGAEYRLPRSRFCGRSIEHGFSTIKKRLALGAWRRTCGS